MMEMGLWEFLDQASHLLFSLGALRISHVHKSSCFLKLSTLNKTISSGKPTFPPTPGWRHLNENSDRFFLFIYSDASSLRGINFSFREREQKKQLNLFIQYVFGVLMLCSNRSESQVHPDDDLQKLDKIASFVKGDWQTVAALNLFASQSRCNSDQGLRIPREQTL